MHVWSKHALIASLVLVAGIAAIEGRDEFNYRGLGRLDRETCCEALMQPHQRKTMLRRLVVDDGGQDLIEYALLSALIGICCVLVWPNIRLGIAAAFIGWDTNVQTLSSCTPDPGGGGC